MHCLLWCCHTVTPAQPHFPGHSPNTSTFLGLNSDCDLKTILGLVEVQWGMCIQMPTVWSRCFAYACMVAWTRWSTFSGFKSYFCCSHFPQITKTNIQHAMFNSILYALLDLLVVTSLLCVAGCPRTNAGTSKIAFKKCFLSDYQNVSTPYRFLRYIIHLWQQNWECFSDEMMLLREEQGWTHA